jgi:outer membrane receptor for ferric coprogen and ferric-rhodotorulic acid
MVDLQGLPILDATGYNVPLQPFNRNYASSQTYGGVLRVLPWLALGGGYFESALFTDSVSFELTGKPRLPRSGEGHELSLRFNFLQDRINATITNFKSVSENNALALSAASQTELNALLPADFRLQGTGDYRDQASRGWEVEVLGNMTRRWTLRATYTMNRVVFSRFFPLVRPYLAAARVAARARGLDAATATSITQDLIDNTEGAVMAVRRETANLATRYNFTEGRFKGLAIGTSASYALGKPRPAITIAGVEVLPAIRTDSYVLINPFASYRRKIFGRNATFQLNVNNVFDLRSDQGLSYTWPRWTDPRQFICTTTFNW